MNLLEDKKHDPAIGAVAGLLTGGMLVVGSVYGCVLVFSNSVKSPDKSPPPPVVIPACMEEDSANKQVVDMPINISNENIGNRICFVRVAVGRSDSRIEFRYR